MPAAAAMLKIAEMEYNGVNSLFLRTLIEKKYALVSSNRFCSKFTYFILLAVSSDGRAGVPLPPFQEREARAPSFVASVFSFFCINLRRRYLSGTERSAHGADEVPESPEDCK